jgi:2-polyprenyl-3-methyl-5-hydroxy-6-metoxy-1,4-benzoquinol methylase
MSEYKDYGFRLNEPAHTFGYLRDSLLSMLDKTTNKCILDLGCGNGYLANYLISQGFNVYGTDASEEGISIAKKTNPDRFFIQDLSTGELPDQLKNLPFDTIISTEVIEHLYDPFKFAVLCKKILLPTKGQLILSTPYHGYLKNLLLSLFDKWDQHINPLWQGGHIKFWSVKTLSGLLGMHGFKVTSFKGCGRVPYLWMSMLIKAKVL